MKGFVRYGVVAVLAASTLAQTEQDSCKVLDIVPEFFGSSRENVGGSCSRRGTCVNSTCVCEDGWTGKSDFVNFEGYDCQMSETGLRVLWGFNTFLSVVYFLMGVPKVYLRWRQHVEIRDTKLEQGIPYSIRNNRGLLACFSHNLITFPSMLAAGILMQVDPSQRVGIDAGMTILFAFGKLGFYLSVLLFQPALLSSILKGKRSTLYLVKINDRLSFLLCLFAIFLGFLPIITLAHGEFNGTVALTVYYVVMGGTVLQLICLGVQAWYVKKKVIRVLNKSLSLTQSERTEKIKKALVAVQNENLVQVCIQGLIYGAFCFWPFMMNKHAYFLPVGWLAYAILGRKLAYTTVSSGSGATGTGSKSGSKSGSSFNRSKDDDRTKDYNSSQVITTAVPQTPETKYTKNFMESVVSFAENLSSGDDSDGENDYV